MMKFNFIVKYKKNRKNRPKFTWDNNTSENCPLCQNAIPFESVEHLESGWVITKNKFPVMRGELLLIRMDHNGNNALVSEYAKDLIRYSHDHPVSLLYSCVAYSIPSHFHVTLIKKLKPILLKAKTIKVKGGYSITKNYPATCVVIIYDSLEVASKLLNAFIDVLKKHQIVFSVLFIKNKIFIHPASSQYVDQEGKKISAREIAGIFCTSRYGLFKKLLSKERFCEEQLEKSSFPEKFILGLINEVDFQS